jgi:hypothetical protein
MIRPNRRQPFLRAQNRNAREEQKPGTAEQSFPKEGDGLGFLCGFHDDINNLIVQRSNFPNSDASDVRRKFQKAAVNALAKESNR